ncbi:MAG: type II toxin-antitoxin system PemK/MazF family toxin [Saprospiraceae bacterium]
MKQFEVWLADLNPGFGTDPGKIRPVVVVQNNFVTSQGHASTIICPLTTKLTVGTKILRIRIFKKNIEIFQDSEILIDQIRAIDNRRLLKCVGTIDDKTISRMKESLAYILDL